MLKEYQKRVVAERAELDGKIVKLAAYLYSDAGYQLDDDDRNLMHHQLSAMRDYSRVLTLRIEAFSN